jgi:tRNA G18 (ribose-2'-O)-methylase SpoU
VSPVIRLTDVNDARVAAYHHIPDPELVRARGLFIAEGRVIVRRLLGLSVAGGVGRFRIRSILLNDASFAAMRDALAPLADAEVDAEVDTDILIASAADLATIGGYDFHRGCLALVERPAPLTLADIGVAAIDTAAAPDRGDGSRDAGVIVILEGVSNADNVGGIFRNAAAFGARAVLIGPRCCDPLYRKATRTSMGATLAVPFVTIGDVERHASAERVDSPEPGADARQAGDAAIARWPEALATVRAAGYRIVALTTHPPAIDIDTFAAAHRGARLALLVGSEGAGLSNTALALATDRVVIPMTGDVDSLNVATAAGIALHRLTRLG